MKTKSKRIYHHLIKCKIIAFLLFFLLALIIYFSSLYFKNIPIIISFILICIVYAIRNYSSFIYLAYNYEISNLKDKDLEEESKGIYFLVLLSFPIIFVTGFFMNLLLQSPNSNSGFVQVFLLFCLLIIVNEFYICFKAAKFHKNAIKGDFTKIKNQNPIGFTILVIFENMGAVYVLILLANKLESPNNIFAFIILFAMIGIMIYLFYNLLKKAEHVD